MATDSIDLRQGLCDRRSIDTDQLPLPGGMTLAKFFVDVRDGKAGKWLSPDDEDAPWRLRSPSLKTAGAEGTCQNLHTGSALAVFVPVGNLTS